MRKPTVMTRLKNRLATVRRDVNDMLDAQPLKAAGLCAAVGGLIGLIVGVTVG